MGKSLKNSVTPDDMYAAFGADTLRLYEMSMAPITQDRPWDTRSVVGSQRLLQRVWRNIVDEQTGELAVAVVMYGEVVRGVCARVRSVLLNIGYAANPPAP